MIEQKTLKQIRYEHALKHGIPLSDQEHDICFKVWLTQKRRPIQPYTEIEKLEGYTEDEWRMREIARQHQIDEFLRELK